MLLLVGIGFATVLEKIVTLVDMDDILFANENYRRFSLENSNFSIIIFKKKF